MPTDPVPQADDDRSIAGAIERVLSARIVSGALAPGARLRQDPIAAEFGASHVPVREAFRRLEAAGLAVAEPRRGVRVAPLEPRDVLEVSGMRAALEALALRAAMAAGLPPAALADAETALRDGERGADIASWEEANRRFHWTLVAPCAMPRLLATIAGLHRASARHLFATWRRLDWQPRSSDEHAAILAAARRGAADRAARLLSDHVVAAGRALAIALRDDAGGVDGGSPPAGDARRRPHPPDAPSPPAPAEPGAGRG